jgi:hypothetical protein
MIQKLLYKGHKRKVHKGTRGGHYVIYNKKKVYLKPISVKKKTKKKTTKKKTTKGKTKSSIRMPRMSNFKKLFGGKKVLITVPEEEPEGDLGIKLTHTRGQRVKGLGEPPWIWRVKNITNGSFGARSGLRAGMRLTRLSHCPQQNGEPKCSNAGVHGRCRKEEQDPPRGRHREVADSYSSSSEDEGCGMLKTDGSGFNEQQVIHMLTGLRPLYMSFDTVDEQEVAEEEEEEEEEVAAVNNEAGYDPHMEDIERRQRLAKCRDEWNRTRGARGSGGTEPAAVAHSWPDSGEFSLDFTGALVSTSSSEDSDDGLSGMTFWATKTDMTKIITVPEAQPKGNLGIEWVGEGNNADIWTVKELTERSFGKTSGLEVGNRLMMISTEPKLETFTDTGRSKKSIIHTINNIRPLYLIFNRFARVTPPPPAMTKIITVPEEEPEGDLGIKLVNSGNTPNTIWTVKNITNGSFGARSGLRAGNCLTMINTRNKLVDFKPTARASTAPGGLLSKQDVIDMINTSRPLYLIFN